ncbi:MAG: DUF362 domain-containing protein [Myxococcales bacterium]
MTRPDAKTRRQFLKDAARAAGAASLAGVAGCFPDVGGHWPRVTEACLGESPEVPAALVGKVSEVFCEASVITKPRYALQEAHVRPMLEAALLGLAPSVELWRQLFPEYGSSTRIGIKVNCLNASCPTSAPLVKALVEILVETLGVSLEQIIVWDRRADELKRCGFSSATVGGAQVLGTVQSPDDESGPGYGEPICGAIAGKTPRLSRILTELTDVTINVPVLKTHDVSGVTAAFKNIYGLIDIPAAYHKNLVQTLPLLYALPPISRSMRLHVLDAYQAIVTGGTSDPPDTVVKTIAVAADPLALDSYSLDKANALREARNMEKLGPVDSTLTGWLEGAAKLRLGKLEYVLDQRTL